MVLVGEVVARVREGAGAIGGDEGVVVGQQIAGLDRGVALAGRWLPGELRVPVAEVGLAADLEPDAVATGGVQARLDGHPRPARQGAQALGAAPRLGEERRVRVDDLRAAGPPRGRRQPADLRAQHPPLRPLRLALAARRAEGEQGQGEPGGRDGEGDAHAQSITRSGANAQKLTISRPRARSARGSRRPRSGAR